MAATYNTEKGLDWDALRADYEAGATPEELHGAKAAAKAIQRGANLADAGAAAREAIAKEFPKSGGDRDG